MIVDIEYCDALSGRNRADGGVAEIGIAAEIIRSGVMSWRTAQGETGPFVAFHRLQGG